MQTGTYISGLGHGGVIAWLLVGGLFGDPPPEVEVTEVAVISAQEFAALYPPAPEMPAEVPEPLAPAQTDPVPETPAITEAPRPVARPEVTQPETRPDAVPDQPEPLNQVTIDNTPPDLPIAPEPGRDDTALVQPEAAPSPAPRVAPMPAPAPEPDVAIDDITRESTTPSDTAEADTPPVEDSTAPEAASSQIVTEAVETDDLQLTSSLKPRARPARPAAPVQTAQPAPQPEQEPDAPTPSIQDTAVQAALREAMQRPSEQTTSRGGPPMSSGEVEALRVAVRQCWNVGALSQDALRTSVTVTFDMNDNGTPRNETVRLVGSSGGTGESARQSYEAARRAIIRCGARGFPLPREKYELWKTIEITFNPEGMRIK